MNSFLQMMDRFKVVEGIILITAVLIVPNTHGIAEYAALMIAAVQNCYTVVGLLCGERDDRPQVAAFEKYLEMVTGSTDLLTTLGQHDFNPEWDEPREL